jgi:multiple sugar transport system substrate-binding protein/raffinose/stachyose/melibiose transport system substrate-binding protein
LLKGLGATAAGAVLAACAAPTPETVVVKETVVVEVEGTPEVREVEKVVTVEVEVEAPAPEEVVLRWWSYYSDTGRCLLCAGLAKEFEDQNPGISLELSHGAAAYSEKLATAFSAGDPPELAGTTHTTVTLQVSDGALVDLGDWYAQSGTLDTMHPAAQAWNTFEGSLYSVSGWDLFCQEWYYNTVAFENAGVSEPTTPAELYQVCRDLEGTVRFPFLFAGTSNWLWPEFMALYQAQTTGITPIMQANEAKDFNIPSLLEAVEIFNAVWQEIVPEESLGINSDDLIATFAQGEVGIMTFHSAWLPGINASIAEAGDVAKIATFADPILFVDEPASPWPGGYGSCFVVPKQNQHLPETYDLMSYVWSLEVQERIAAADLGIPAFEDVWGAVQNPLFQGAIRHIGQSTAESLFWVDFMHPRVNEAVYTGCLAMVQGEGDAQGVLDAMTEAAQTAEL